MNSNSRYCDDYESCGESCKKDKRPAAPTTTVKCGALGSAIIPLATPVGTTFTLASLTLNNSSANSCACTKIEVTSNLSTVAFTGAVSFQVFKQCRNQFTPVPVGPAFTFAEAVLLTAADAFTFFVCDCDNCDTGCCVYSLVATVTTIIVGTLTINNATLAAITSTNPGCCC